MADLDFKHHVGEIPRGEQLPQSKGPAVKAEIGHTPDFQGAVSNYAEATNWMSSVGSAVATRASSAIATKLGGELGKNPQGELGPSFTNFDKQLAQSYATQAQSTLGLQAQALISKTNLEIATQPRINANMIADAQKSTMQGLQKIFALAPDEVRTKMETQYGAEMINQNEHLVNRMLGEQKTDRIQNLEISSQTNAESAHSLALAGQDKGAESAMNATIAAAKSAAARHDISPAQAKVIEDTVRQSMLSGRVTGLALKAQKEGKLPEFEKSLADNPGQYGITDKDHATVINNTLQYMNMQTQLRTQDQQLKIAEFNTKLLRPDLITASELSNLKSQLGPIQAANMEFKYRQALAQYKGESQSKDALIAGWGNAEVQTRASEKTQKVAFDDQVNKMVENSGGLVSHDEAQVKVALAAGAPIKVFTDGLNNKLTGGSPANILSASMQVQALRDQEGGHALIGLSKQADVIAFQFNHQRGSMSDSDLARKITDNIMNIDKPMQDILDNAWNRQLSAKGAGGLGGTKSLYSFALDEVGLGRDQLTGLRKDRLGGTYFETIYGNDIYNQLKSNFDVARGDYQAALEMTKRYVEQNYGETRINGNSIVSDRPIERTLGYKDYDVVPFIQHDLLTQMNTVFDSPNIAIKSKDENGKEVTNFITAKENYEKNKTGEYWSIKQVEMPSHKFNTGQRINHPAAQVIRHIKTPKGKKEYSYPVNLVGRPGNEWDITLQTPDGPRSLFLIASNLGITTFKPNEESIRQNYDAYKNKRWWL